MQRVQGVKEFTQSVDAVLVEMMSKNAPHLWDKQLLQVLKQYDDKDNRKCIYLYKKAIGRLKTRLEKREDDPMTRMILRKTLHSYERRLEEALDIQTSTPPSSDDEDAEESIENFFDFTISNQPDFYDAPSHQYRPFKS